jgi:uncharacterized protein
LIIVVDTSGMISAVNDRSASHRETRVFLDELGADPNVRLVVSPFVLAEVDYLISHRDNRPDIALQVLRDVAADAYHLEPFEPADLNRAAGVTEYYGDQDIGLADASNVVLAERHGTSSILTLDERHFRVLRGPGGRPFRLLPADR